ncbi:MAG: helix-turn-helix transcriptional regulator [Planctomycetes bacterium]|nr:helix-turn-helix transcriptional regulator [Planctomycetota bacterium]
MTPLQAKVAELITAYERQHGTRLSGREIADRLGKSRNHLSQIMNDGLVPSGEALMSLADVLEASAEDRDDLVMAALRTKAGARSRDSFWLEKALELLDELGAMKRFLDDQGQAEAFRAWLGRPDEPEDGIGPGPGAERASVDQN